MEQNLLKVAVPTSDGENIFNKMLGQAAYFYIYSIDKNGRYSLPEKRKNPYEKTLQHLKTLDVYDVIKDCPLILSAKIGKKGIERLKERGVRLIFNTGNIEKALDELIKNNL